jgi:hypothetical protein
VELELKLGVNDGNFVSRWDECTHVDEQLQGLGSRDNEIDAFDYTTKSEKEFQMGIVQLSAMCAVLYCNCDEMKTFESPGYFFLQSPMESLD